MCDANALVYLHYGGITDAPGPIIILSQLYCFTSSWLSQQYTMKSNKQKQYSMNTITETLYTMQQIRRTHGECSMFSIFIGK